VRLLPSAFSNKVFVSLKLVDASCGSSPETNFASTWFSIPAPRKNLKSSNSVSRLDFTRPIPLSYCELRPKFPAPVLAVVQVLLQAPVALQEKVRLESHRPSLVKLSPDCA
jgi:hypothetical protein